MTVIGLDIFNFCLTGNVTETLRGQRVDTVNLPCVLIEVNDAEDTDREEVL